MWVIESDDGTRKEFETKAAAQDKRTELVSGGLFNSGELDIKQVENGTTVADGNGEAVKQAPPDSEPKEPEVIGAPDDDNAAEPIPDTQPDLDEDPVEWMPGHFVDEIQGVPTVNRKGYAVIAAKFGVSVTAEPITLAEETDFEYATFRAVATTSDGEEYTGIGSAHVERQDGDDKHLLNELAETRAMKRATAWATGVGMTAVEELEGEP